MPASVFGTWAFSFEITIIEKGVVWIFLHQTLIIR